jgi:hypothetical protein
VGRPKVSIDQAKKLFGLQVSTAIRKAQGESLKSALYDAMRVWKWPDLSPAEHKRLAERFRVRPRSGAAENEEDLRDPN